MNEPADLRPAYDVVVCGAGTSGCVVAGRLSEDPAVQVLLLEAGGDDDVPEVTDPERWQENLGSERDWGFRARPRPAVAGRGLGMSMGKVLGGGSSINVAVWARGHRSDWDHFAERTGDPAWGYEAVLGLYRRIEDWRGTPDPERRGAGGPVQVSPVPYGALGEAAATAAAGAGIPSFDSWNGAMMEAPAGIGHAETTLQEQGRRSVYRDYVHPFLDRPNLTVVTGALVTRVVLEGGRATGVELRHDGRTVRVGADAEVVLSLGAVNSPAVLMRSGIGDAEHLRSFGIPVLEHLPAVGRGFQDHPLTVGGVWESPRELSFSPVPQAGLYLRTGTGPGPDVQGFQYEGLYPGISDAEIDAPTPCWSIVSALVRPTSRGRVTLTGPGPDDAPAIDANHLGDQCDVDALVTAVGLYRELAASSALRPWTGREVFPGPGRGGRTELERLVRSTATTYWHQCGTNAMGRDEASVVDGRLAVHGVDHLRVVDASVMPRITTGNIMAPCIVIGERASDVLRAEHATT